MPATPRKVFVNVHWTYAIIANQDGQVMRLDQRVRSAANATKTVDTMTALRSYSSDHTGQEDVQMD
jgi:hypothetical protein